MDLYGLVPLCLVLVSSMPCVFFSCKCTGRKKTKSLKPWDLYADCDGTANRSSQRSFASRKAFFRTLSVVCAGFALSLSVPLLDIATHHGQALALGSWWMPGSWALLVLQTLGLVLERAPTERYTLSVWGAFTASIILVSTCAKDFVLLHPNPAAQSTTWIVLRVAHLGACVLAILAFLSFQRRPVVYADGRPVDAEGTCSALSRLTFSWAASTLALARENKHVGLDDLPRIPYRMRSSALLAYSNDSPSNERLWRKALYLFESSFLWQLALTVIASVAKFGPQYAMFHLLKLFEERRPGTQGTNTALLWVLALGVCMCFTALVESWVLWIGWSRIAIPIRAMLSILIFTKSTRRKYAKAGRQEEFPARIDVAPSAYNDVAESVERETLPEGGPDGSHQSKRMLTQSASNLVAVDIKRISDFASLCWFFPASAVRLIVSGWFLHALIGWTSLLAGILAWSLTVPINVFVSRRYSGFQSDLMSVRDQRLAAVTEALRCIRHIKFSAAESQWEARIGEHRSRELALQWKVFVCQMGLLCLLMSGPVLLATVSLITYACTHPTLKPSVAFTAIAIFGYIEFTLAIVPELVTNAIDAWTSVRRVEEYMEAPEKDCSVTESDAIVFENASVAWPSDSTGPTPDTFHLRAVDLRFPPGELSVVSGKTGSGKSLLLAAILGEADQLSGTIKRPRAPPSGQRFDGKATRSDWIIDSAMAYVAQVPWIENATVRDNILFGLPYDHDRYERTLTVCALRCDLDMLADGDLTEIGANGINLSGGQRWRVSFARALYSRAGILILDDLLSSLDSQVARQLLEGALAGDLGVGRTRILVTHHLDLCQSQPRYAVLLGRETVEYAGLAQGIDRSATLEDTMSLALADNQKRVDALPDGQLSDADGPSGADSSQSDDRVDDKKVPPEPRKFTEDETRDTGTIQLKLYKRYVSSTGGLTWWVSQWTRDHQTESISVSGFLYQQNIPQGYLQTSTDKYESDPRWLYLAVYVALSVTAVLIGTAKYAWAYKASVRASQVLFDNVMSRVLRAPLRWLDTVPIGRILNRFTADFSVLDSRLVNDVAEFLFTLLELCGISIAGFLVSPVMIVFAGVSVGVAVMIGTRYLSGAREVKRLESIAKSPILELFDCVRAGLGTIRAYDEVERYVNRMHQAIDSHTTALMHLWLFNQWMSFRLSLIAALFAASLAALIVLLPGIDASLAGFALAFALRYNDAVIWTIRSYASLEMDMNATERIVEYSQVEAEPLDGDSAPASWPSEGRLEVNGLVAGYAPDLPPVLDRVSFTVEKNQRVGIVGRTGAGKSSLALALFRILEAREGTIKIDGIDISRLKLHDLRSRMTIIPQDPVLFSGTVRSNLDPFGEHTDAELRVALGKVHLVRDLGEENTDVTPLTPPPPPPPPPNPEPPANIFTSLSTPISASGLSLSQGQRQLLCLARAILSRPKLTILDEATSAVDKATDTLIQRSLHREFGGGGSTLLVIAHRLATVAGFDRILVLSEGRAVEYGAPRELMEGKGKFWEMVRGSGDREMLEEMILGGG
ncbi:MAG: hypothetical protein LQ345_002349 [Seirophora villosa]|nr:MAG: hypothetical protein LQ345_002349 [Seirophora villosa]